MEVLSWILFEENGEDSGQEHGRLPLPQEDRKRIGGVLVERIKKALADPGKVAAIPPKELVRYLSIWATMESQSVTSEFVAKVIEADARYTLLILDALRPTGWNMMTGIPRKSDFRRGEYDTLLSFADPALICQSLEAQVGPYQRTEHYPRDFDGTSPDRSLADQFYWIHNYVLEEAAKQRESSELKSKIEPLQPDDTDESEGADT